MRRPGNAEDCGYRLAKLKRRTDFVRVAAARRSAAGPGLVLQAAQRSEECRSLSNIRVGYTASRKVGNAVVRNRAKRRLREVAAKVLPNRGKPATDYVLIARESTAHRPFPALVADLEAALRRIEHGEVRRRAHIAPDSD